jgi:hypothetical protein
MNYNLSLLPEGLALYSPLINRGAEPSETICPPKSKKESWLTLAAQLLAHDLVATECKQLVNAVCLVASLHEVNPERLMERYRAEVKYSLRAHFPFAMFAPLHSASYTSSKLMQELARFISIVLNLPLEEQLSRATFKSLAAQFIVKLNQVGYTEFSGLNFSELDFSHQQFKSCDFSQCYLGYTNLTKVSFYGCNFSLANMWYSNLTGTTFNNCYLHKTKIHSLIATLDCVLTNTKLSGFNFPINDWSVYQKLSGLRAKIFNSAMVLLTKEQQQELTLLSHDLRVLNSAETYQHPLQSAVIKCKCPLTGLVFNFADPIASNYSKWAIVYSSSLAPEYQFYQAESLWVKIRRLSSYPELSGFCELNLISFEEFINTIAIAKPIC